MGLQHQNVTIPFYYLMCLSNQEGFSVPSFADLSLFYIIRWGLVLLEFLDFLCSGIVLSIDIVVALEEWICPV